MASNNIIIASIIIIMTPCMALAQALSSEHKKDLMVFSMKASGVSATAEDIKSLPSDHDLYDVVGLGLNLNSHLCAEIEMIRPLESAGTYEATCIAYKGGVGKKTYIIDSGQGTAFEQ